jgi:V/A-type H+-transporting ATPase subunit K
MAIGMSAWFQGRAAAGACDAQAETGKGTANYILALGIVESVAILVLAFMNIF